MEKHISIIHRNTHLKASQCSHEVMKNAGIRIKQIYTLKKALNRVFTKMLLSRLLAISISLSVDFDIGDPNAYCTQQKFNFKMTNIPELNVLPSLAELTQPGCDE